MQPANLDQQVLYDQFLRAMLVTVGANAHGMTLEAATRAIVDSAAGALFYAHEAVGRLDLLDPLYEADRLAKLIVALKQGDRELF